MFNELFVGVEGTGPRAWIFSAGGNCECYCQCLGDALFAAQDSIIESGGFVNGVLIRGLCFEGPTTPECDGDPAPYDCNLAGSLMRLDVSINTACHEWSGSINLNGVPASGHYEIADFIVPDSGDCMRLDIEFDCIGGSAAEVTMVIRSDDEEADCATTYTRLARHVGPTNVYEVSVRDTTNKCCCPCAMCGLPDSLDWEFDLYTESGVFDATYTGTSYLVAESSTACTWIVDDPGSAAVPTQIVVTKLSTSVYRVVITAGSGFEGEPILLGACPTGMVTAFATGNAGESALSNIKVNFG